MEDITDEIHEWFVVWYNATGQYDVFPAANLGGSVLIATGQTSTPEEYLVEKREIAKQLRTRGRRAEMPTAVPPKPEALKEKAPGWTMPETHTLPCLEEANADFIENWSLRDESDNPEQKEYLDLIAEKLCYELQLEIREIVDELMRAELELLNKALQKDRGRDKKRTKAAVRKGIIVKKFEIIKNQSRRLSNVAIIRIELYLSQLYRSGRSVGFPIIN